MKAGSVLDRVVHGTLIDHARCCSRKARRRRRRRRCGWLVEPWWDITEPAGPVEGTGLWMTSEMLGASR